MEPMEFPPPLTTTKTLPKNCSSNTIIIFKNIKVFLLAKTEGISDIQYTVKM